MKVALFIVIIIGCLLLSCDGMGLAEPTPVYTVHLQGNSSHITGETDGMATVTISDIRSHMNISLKDWNTTARVGEISISVPLQAALVVHQAENPSVFFMNVSQISLSDNNRTITLLVEPLLFYEGSVLSALSGVREDLNQIEGAEFNQTELYLESVNEPPTNAWDPMNHCNLCRTNCNPDNNYKSCILDCCITYCSQYGVCQEQG